MKRKSLKKILWKLQKIAIFAMNQGREKSNRMIVIAMSYFMNLKRK